MLSATPSAPTARDHELRELARLRSLLRHRVCHEAVVRGGEDEPCEKTAVALRYDPEEGNPYPVCACHTRGADMVPLADFLTTTKEKP